MEGPARVRRVGARHERAAFIPTLSASWTSWPTRSSSSPLEGKLDWARFEKLFDRITLRVIFGDDARDDQELTELLEKLMGEANRLVGLSENDAYYEFYGLIERKLRDPEPGTLIAHVADAPHSDRTRVAHQIPHWMFAMRDTLGANTYRALALIVADADVERRVREEIAGGDLSDPSFVGGLAYLEGCLQEAMRLWPTVPLLARETTRDTDARRRRSSTRARR